MSDIVSLATNIISSGKYKKIIIVYYRQLDYISTERYVYVSKHVNILENHARILYYEKLSDYLDIVNLERIKMLNGMGSSLRIVLTMSLKELLRTRSFDELDKYIICQFDAIIFQYLDDIKNINEVLRIIDNEEINILKEVSDNHIPRTSSIADWLLKIGILRKVDNTYRIISVELQTYLKNTSTDKLLNESVARNADIRNYWMQRITYGDSTNYMLHYVHKKHKDDNVSGYSNSSSRAQENAPTSNKGVRGGGNFDKKTFDDFLERFIMSPLVIAVLINIATNTLPKSFDGYLWISYFLISIHLILSVYRDYRERDENILLMIMLTTFLCAFVIVYIGIMAAYNPR